jgi:hypothetical protein
MDSDLYRRIVIRIIEEQESIIGPLALDRAKKVPGMNVDWSHHDVQMDGDNMSLIDLLIRQYSDFFGQAAVEVCKEAASSLLSQLPPEQRPLSLA